MAEKIITWEVNHVDSQKKSSAWYWTVGIVGIGVAVASIILDNLLLGILVVIASLAIMLAGSQTRVKQKCALSEKGIHIDASLVPYANIVKFAISEDEPKKLTLATKGMTGTIPISLSGADFRVIRTELKNRNIEEVEKLNSLGEKLADAIGM